MIHRSTIDRFIADKGRKAPTTDPKTLTLQDRLADPEIGNMIATSYATVREDANLADAKKAMDSILDCQDVYVTKGGTPSEPVSGWVTNIIIEDNAHV